MSKKGRYYLGKTTRHTASPCLNCGDMLDAASGIGHRKKPSPGAISLCLMCGHIMVYKADMTFRELNDEEIVGIAGNKTVLVAQEAAGKARAMKKKRDEEKNDPIILSHPRVRSQSEN